jgi:hypothetical protein
MTFRETIVDELRKADPALPQTDPAWAPAAFLMASALLGPDPERIAAEMEMDPITAGIYAERARIGGIWRGGAVQTAAWTDGDTGGLSFWMDASIIGGDIERVGEDKYQVSAAGKARVERMLRR